MSHVIVTTGARLHFGLLAHAPGASRRFGGVGLMIEQPEFEIAATLSDRPVQADRFVVDEYTGPAEWASRVLDFVQNCRVSSPSSGTHQDVIRRWELRSVIPAHVGLGSGTQLGLAIARAWMLLHGESAADATTLAIRAGRGLRSALGIHGFYQGGFLVEAGKRAASQVSPVVARTEFPADWRLVLICPRNERGLSGPAEIAAFSALPSMSEVTSAALCRIVLLELLPAVQESDFDACSDALYRFGCLIGEYFAPAQGGVFASSRMASLVDWLRRRGINGVGQSSWGPLLFAVCSDAAMAKALEQDLRNSNWGDCEILTVAAKNTGAKVEIHR